MFESYPFVDSLILFFILFVCIIISMYVLYRILRNPFKYPYFEHTFNVTSKRNVKIEDYIDNFLCDSSNWHMVQEHERYICQWKNETERYIQNCKLKSYRSKQYWNILDDNCAYRFATVRQQTRYRQRNYIRTPYKVWVTDSEWTTNWQWLSIRHMQLEQINFEATINDYNSKQQRKLVTYSLRKKIMERDDYTCQNCGKYMPDEVGIQIDHIIPIAKGGKSIPSNLRVLCSKCNGQKGAK